MDMFIDVCSCYSSYFPSIGDSGHSHKPSHQWPTLIFCDNSNCHKAGKTLPNKADQ